MEPFHVVGMMTAILVFVDLRSSTMVLLSLASHGCYIRTADSRLS